MYRIGLDSIPAKHRNVIAWLAQPGIRASTTHNVAAGLEYQDGPIRDVLEELATRRVVIRHAGASERDDTWSLACWAHQRWDAVAPCLPTQQIGPDEAALETTRESDDDLDADVDPLDREQGIGRYRPESRP